MSKQFQDISFSNWCDCPNCYTNSLLYDFLIKQFRQKQHTFIKRRYSEKFNKLHTLKHDNVVSPYDIKTNQRFIFIAGKNKVSIFNRLSRTHHANIKMQHVSFTTLGIDPNDEDNLYITGNHHGFIYHYKFDNKLSIFTLVKKFGHFSWITNIVIDNSFIYCVERIDDKICVLNKQDGQLVREIKNTFIVEPWSMVLYNKDYFFLSSLKLKTIAKLSLLDGKLIQSYDLSEIDGISGMIFNYKTNHLIVCSFGLSKIFIFDYKTLELIKEIEHLNLSGVMGIDIDCDENLYISEYSNGRITILN